MIPVIDVFAGPGGLGEGFAAFKNGSRNPFGLCLSIEKDEFAHQTLLLRTFYRQFDRDPVPDDYYSLLRGKISCEELFSRHPDEAAFSRVHAWQAELGVTPWENVTTRISKALSKRKEWVLIGGPPCQAYSLVGRARRNGIRNYDPENDNRTTLYREYLKIIAHHWPAVFVMENVPGLLSHLQLEERIFDRMLDDLRDPAAAVFRSRAKTIARRHGYKIVSLVPRQRDLFSNSEADDYVVRSEEFGIPQKRHRVILLGIRDDLTEPETKLVPAEKRIPAAHVLNPLPRLRSGLSKEGDSARTWKSRIQEALTSKWLATLKSDGNGVYKQLVENLESIPLPRHDRGDRFIEYDAVPNYQPDWFTDKHLGGVCNHETRGHIADDLHRYIFVSSFAEVYKRSPKLGDFPQGLLPDHKNVNGNLQDVPFSDRFRVQLRDQPATTVTSHVAKDGHYYIHPDPRQCRSLTVREAARLQTFPDNYLFLGPRTEQYTQVGNAVPPLLAKQIAHVVYRLFKDCGLE